MEKILLFCLVILSVCALAAQETASEEPENGANETVKAEVPAEAQPAAEPAKEEPKEETQPNVAAELEKQAETSHQAVLESTEISEEKEDVVEARSKAKGRKKAKMPKMHYSRPYLGAGIPMIVLGSLSVALLMPAMSAMALAASDTGKDKDSKFWTELRNDDHAAWTAGAVLSGVLGAGMVAVGGWMVTVKKPLQNQYVEVTELSVVPTNEGMFASFGLKF